MHREVGRGERPSPSLRLFQGSSPLLSTIDNGVSRIEDNRRTYPCRSYLVLPSTLWALNLRNCQKISVTTFGVN